MPSALWVKPGHILIWKQCGSRSAGFCRTQLIRFNTIFRSVWESMVINSFMQPDGRLTRNQIHICLINFISLNMRNPSVLGTARLQRLELRKFGFMFSCYSLLIVNNKSRDQTVTLTVQTVRNLFCTFIVSLQQMSRNMRFPTMWYVRVAKAQISLHICAFWSEPLLVAWIIWPNTIWSF